ncbi:DoxX family protein [Algimonas porphyrae]|uniref:DoxX family protein n=1 Tax=Algimonas porphyrae TaxID=1128113 RepID=A0ABQ5V6M1_9PROT|nr:DoxX family protein [Algimonas porphyrae]GLQ21922.1 hypothetical protein GCM10007854_28770 [Algimonas porphyrae]
MNYPAGTRFYTAGRVITGLFFVLAGTNKILSYPNTLDMMQAAGLTPATLLLPLTIALEIGAGAFVMLGRGRRIVVMAALALCFFTLATNLIFHRFWTLDGGMQQLQLSLFFKNLVVIAALLMIAGQGCLGQEKTRHRAGSFDA